MSPVEYERRSAARRMGCSPCDTVCVDQRRGAARKAGHARRRAALFGSTAFAAVIAITGAAHAQCPTFDAAVPNDIACDDIEGGEGVFTRAGDDTITIANAIVGENSIGVVDSGADNDVIKIVNGAILGDGPNGRGMIYGQAGDDTVRVENATIARFGWAQIIGGEDDDDITITSQSKVAEEDNSRVYIYGMEGDDTIEIAGDTVLGEHGHVALITAYGDDSISITGDSTVAAEIESVVKIRSGVGADTIHLNKVRVGGSSATNGGSVEIAGDTDTSYVLNYEDFPNLGDDIILNDATIGVGANSEVTIDGEFGADKITIHGGVIGHRGDATINGGDGADTIDIQSAAFAFIEGASAMVDGGAGADMISISDSSIIGLEDQAAVTGGADNDEINILGAATVGYYGAAQILGDAGDDTINISGGAVIGDFAAATISGGADNDVITISENAMVGVDAAGVISGDEGHDRIVVEGGAVVTMRGHISGGSGNDTIVLDETITNFSEASINGGEGADYLAFRNAASAFDLPFYFESIMTDETSIEGLRKEGAGRLEISETVDIGAVTIADGVVDLVTAGNLTATKIDIEKGMLQSDGDGFDVGATISIAGDGAMEIRGIEEAASVQNAGTVAIAGEGDFDVGAFTNLRGGEVQIVGGAALTVKTQRLENAADIVVTGGRIVADVGGVSNLADGTMRFTGGALSVGEESFVNEGEVNAAEGRLAITGNVFNGNSFIVGDTVAVAGDVENDGVLEIASNATLEANILRNRADSEIAIGANAKFIGTGNTLANAAKINVGAGGSITGAGNIENAADGVITFSNGGALTAGGPQGVVNHGAIELTAGTLAVTGDVHNHANVGIAGAAAITGGVSNTASLRIEDDSTLAAASISNREGGVIAIGADATLRGAGTIFRNDAAITIAAGGAVDQAGDIENTANGVIIFNDGGAMTAGGDNGVVNDGAIELVAGLLTIDGNLSNANMVNIAGAVEIDGAVDNEGLVTIADGASFSAMSISNRNAGVISVGAGATLNGAGNTLTNASTIRVAAGGAVRDAGDITNDVGGVMAFSAGGTLSAGGAGGVANNGVLSIAGGDLAVSGALQNRGTILFDPAAVHRITIDGDFTQTADGVLSIGIIGAESDQIQVDGDVTLGGEINFASISGLTTGTWRYPVLTATGSISGSFDAVSGVLLDQNYTVDATTSEVLLTLVLDPVSTLTDLTPNESRTIETLFDALADERADSDLSSLTLAIAGLDDERDAGAALRKLHPESLDVGLNILSRTHDRFVDDIMRAAAPDGERLWGGVKTSRMERDADEAHIGYRASGYDFTAGMWAPMGPAIRVGLAGGYSEHNGETKGADGDEVDATLFRVALSGRADINPAGGFLSGHVDSVLSFTAGETDVALRRFADAALVRAVHMGAVDVSALSFSTRFTIAGARGRIWGVSPFIEAGVTRTTQDAVRIGDDAPSAILVDNLDQRRGAVRVGAQYERQWGDVFALRGALSGVQFLGDTHNQFETRFARADRDAFAFRTDGSAVKRQAMLTLGGYYKMGDGMTINVSALGETGDLNAYSARLGLSKQF